MTVTAELPETRYFADGAQASFPIGFEIPDLSGLEVLVRNVLQTEGPDYNVVGANVVFPVAPTVNARISFRRFTIARQPASFPTSDTVQPRTLEREFDRVGLHLQELDARAERNQEVPIGEYPAPAVPPKSARAGTIRIWNDDGSNERTDVTLADILALIGQGQSRTNDVPDLRDYGGDPTGTHSSDAAVRRFAADCSTLKCRGHLADGVWVLDGASPIYMGEYSAWEAAMRPAVRLGWQVAGANVQSLLINPGCTFGIDVKGANKNVPKIALQGFNALSGVNFVGMDLLGDRTTIDVSAYPTIDGSPTDHAEPLIMDFKHDAYGGLLGSASKGGNIILENLNGVGLRRFLFLGDAHPSEEPMLAPYMSGQVTGTGNIRIRNLSGYCLERVMGFARITSGGLRVQDALFIPPNWTGISQPIPAGVEASLLKWAQQNSVFCHGRHRGIGLMFEGVTLRGFRAGWHLEAGIGLGPNGQDTGKYNGVDMRRINVERVISVLDIEETAYLHQWDLSGYGHAMDEYNLPGEIRPVFWIKTHGQKAGAVDKSVGTRRAPSHLYQAGDKVQGPDTTAVVDGVTVTTPGYIFRAQATGTTAAGTGTAPVSKTPGTTETDGVVSWFCLNAGWKPLAAYGALGQVTIKWRGQEASGPYFENTVNDAHAEFDFSGSKFTNWQQATGKSHAGAIIERSGRVPISLENCSFYKGASDKAFDFVDWRLLLVANSRFFGWEVPDDSDLDAGAPGELGPPPGFSWPNCRGFNFGADNGGDLDDEDT